MNIKRLSILSVAALIFALFETWLAYADKPQAGDIFWAGFSWVCVLFVLGLWWEMLRKK